MNVAVILTRQGKADASMAAANRSISAAQVLMDRHPRDAFYNELLARAYTRLGEAQNVAATQSASIPAFQQVLATYRKTLAVLESDGAHDEPFWQIRLSTTYFFLSYPLRALGELSGDTAYFKEALESELKGDAINRRLVATNPNDLVYLRRMADGLYEIGLLRWRCCRDLAGALRDEEAARDGFQRLLARDAEDVEARRDVANAYSTLGLILGEAGQRSAALEADHKALAVYEQIDRADPTDEENRRYLAELRARMSHGGRF
jgi:tetratricopeptide (TPR) repeat protein